MAKKNDAENGSAFALDDVLDLDSMLLEATDASETTEDDDAYFSRKETAAPAREKERVNVPSPRAKAAEKPQPEPSAPVFDIDDDNELSFLDDEPEIENEVHIEVVETGENKVQEPQPVAVQAEPEPEPTKPAVVTPVIQKPIGLITEADEIKNVARYLRVSDAYRSLSPEKQVVAKHFIVNSSEDVDEASIVVKAIHADPMLKKTLAALTKVYSLEAVEKAFFLMALPLDELQSLSGLVGAVTEGIEPSDDPRKMGKELTYAIEKLDEQVLSYVQATETVLSAADD